MTLLFVIHKGFVGCTSSTELFLDFAPGHGQFSGKQAMKYQVKQ